MKRIHWLHFASPATFYPLAGRWWPVLAALAVVLGAAGLWMAFFVVPTDSQQGEVYRIVYLHVPAAWLSMLLYAAMAAYAALGFVYRTRLSSMMARAIAPTGALYCAISLVTGALWGQPTWGTWWVWDARLGSQLLLLFLYVGFLGLHSAFDDPDRADRAAGLLAIVGALNLPVIYFSVRWWNTLHQGASVSLTEGSRLDSPMLAALLLMTAALWCHAAAVVLLRLRCIVCERETEAAWLARENGAPAPRLHGRFAEGAADGR